MSPGEEPVLLPRVPCEKAAPEKVHSEEVAQVNLLRDFVFSLIIAFSGMFAVSTLYYLRAAKHDARNHE